VAFPDNLLIKGVYAAKQLFVDMSNDWREKVHSGKKIFGFNEMDPPLGGSALMSHNGSRSRYN